MAEAKLLIGLGAAVVVVGGLAYMANRKPDTKAGADGVLRRDPRELAAEARQPLDRYALGRVLASEERAGRRLEKLAIGHVVANEARARGLSVSALVLRGRTSKGAPSSSDGYFGAQSTGKYVSSAQPPQAEDLEIAARVLSGESTDPTGGARQFDHPKAQNALVAAGAKGYTVAADELAERRLKTNTLVTVPGIAPGYLRFWKPKGVA